METDVDCGGFCGSCEEGKDCKYDGDCATNNCAGGKCGPIYTCMNLKKDGSETDVDCGGPDCPGCPLNWFCVENNDCLSLSCSLGACIESSCDDGSLNQDETDVDCGGKVCPKCPDGKQCTTGLDCVSSSCKQGVCGECIADCTDKQCGNDGCGGACGTCGLDGYCNEGACAVGDGHCENDYDMEIILNGNDDDHDPAVQAAILCTMDQCLMDLTCIANCLEEGIGISEPCAGCYADVGLCAFTSCQNNCVMDSSSAKCVLCVEDGCLDDLPDCSGLIYR